MKRIDYKSALLFSAATIPGAILGRLPRFFIPRRLFNGIFGIFLMATSIFLFLRRVVDTEEEKPAQTLVDPESCRGGRHLSYLLFNPVLGVGLSLFAGFVSSLLGIGAALSTSPVLIHLLNFPVHIATRDFTLCLGGDGFRRDVCAYPDGSIFPRKFGRTACLAVGVLIGAQLGAYLSNRVHGDWIVRGLAIALGFVGVRIFIMAL